MVFEVYDPAHLQNTFERVVDMMNTIATRREAGLPVEPRGLGGRTYYTLSRWNFGLEVNYTYANGYFVAAPSRAPSTR